MAKTIRGKVEFANGVPAVDVTVRVFDRDESGKQDDDLTLTAGRSDSQGNFEVSYDPGRFRDVVTVVRSEPRNPPFDWTLVRREHRQTDWLDVLLPYLQFDYRFQEQARQHQVSLNWFSSTYSLPQAHTTVPFSPTLNGYHFANAFKGVPLPFSIPEIPGLVRLSGVYGLCGGMSSSAYDHYLYGREIPGNVSTPRSGSVLQRYLYRRQMDTFGTLGEYILKFASWMKLPDDTAEGLCTMTLYELEQFRARLANNAASVLGIVYEKGTKVSHLFLNHQVLGYALDIVDEDHSTIRIYDPNYPNRDDVSIKLERRVIDHRMDHPIYGLACEQWLGGNRLRTIHGFFLMPYIPIPPPARLG